MMPRFNLNSLSPAVFLLLCSPSVWAADTLSKPDNAFVIICAALVILMSLPGLVLFYGGLVRSKNMLSVAMQVFSLFSLISVLWIIYGYSLAFTEGNAVIGGFSKIFLQGVTADSLAATFSKGIFISELTYVVFQGAFAAITCCLIVGSFAERARFGAVLVFSVIWFTFAYLPSAHMVWYWAGPDAYVNEAAAKLANASAGFLFQDGALDFAGGTVVHINSAVAALIGAYFVGQRVGYGKEAMQPHSVTLTLVGTALLLFGWFGFNAGSALEANGVAAFALLNTWAAASASGLVWLAMEWRIKGKPSVLGLATGLISGLVVITPACGFVGVGGALAMGFLGGALCWWGVHGLKRLLKADDSLDVFGIHGVGGIVGALLVAIFASPSLGGSGIWDYVANASSPNYSILGQLWIQFIGIILTVTWSALVALFAFWVADKTIGLRVDKDSERQGLDLSSHGEVAYNH